MAGRTVQSVTEALGDESHMHGWDVIIALDGLQLNNTLQQEYLARLAQGSGLEGFSGNIPIVESDITHYLGGITLGPAQVRFTQASLQDTTAAIGMAITGGTHVKLKNEFGHELALAINVVGAWSNAQLTMEWPMSVGQTQLDLDLASGNNALLTLFNTPVEQAAVGRLFMDWLGEQGIGTRSFMLTRFNYSANPLMHASELRARVQPKPDTDDAALLVFGHFPESGSTSFPGAGFPYLIPDPIGAQRFSATAMFSRPMIHRAAMGHAVMGLLAGGEFEYLQNEAGEFESIRAKNGALPGGAGSHAGERYAFTHPAFSLPSMVGPAALQVTFQTDGARQSWKPAFDFTFNYREKGAATGTQVTARVLLDLKHEFHIAAGDSTDDYPAVEGHLYCPYWHTHELVELTAVPEITPEALPEATQYILLTVKRAILERLFNVLNATEPKSFLAGIELAGQSPIQDFVTTLPFDQALFSEIQPAGADFTITPQEHVLGLGASETLTTVPERNGLTWALQALPGQGQVGQIDALTGRYTAPQTQAELGGDFGRVLVTASDAQGRFSTGMITVLASVLAVNPIIQQCRHNQTVVVSAGVDSTEGLAWGTPAHGALQPHADPLSRIYRPGLNSGDGAYAVDEVTISQAGRAGKAFVLVMYEGAGAVAITPQPGKSTTPRQLQLKAEFNDRDLTERAVWTVLLGPGGVEAGLYTSADQDTDHFVLIHALLHSEIEGDYEGHIILPLPLASHTSVLQALAR